MESRKPVSEEDVRRYKELNAKLQHDLQIALHEKGLLEVKLEGAVAEMERLKVVSQDASTLKINIEELKQQNEALQISLESSERIRKQQKELISMLQRSQSLADISIASVHSYPSHTGGGINDDDSSTQLTHNSGIGSQMSNGPISASSSMQEENKSWLESSPQRQKGANLSSPASVKMLEGIASGQGSVTKRKKMVTTSTGVGGNKMTMKTTHAAGDLYKPRTDTKLFKSEYSQRNLSRQPMTRKGTKTMPSKGSKHTKSQFIRPQYIAPAPYKVSESKTRLVREFEALSPHGQREALNSMKISRSTSAMTSDRPPKYPSSGAVSRPGTAPTTKSGRTGSLPFR